MEEWKDIEGYEGLYQVSSCGRVKSLSRKTNNQYGKEEKILKQGIDKHGYRYIHLYQNSKMKSYQVHRLVANAFIKNPNNYPIINHKDEDKQNNHVSNLEYCTVAYNNCYGTRLKRISKALTGEKNPMYGRTGSKHPKSRKVQCINTGEIFNTITEAAKYAGLKNNASIIGQIKGKRNTAGKDPVTKEKLQWKYVD